MPDERAFLLEHVERYLGRRPAPNEILSMWSGQRPLVRRADASSTAAISRDHTILISPSKLITITGGKWTTYRKMAEDAIDRIGGTPSRTADLRLHGSDGSERARIARGNECTDRTHHWCANFRNSFCILPALSQGEVIWAARHEMARSVEDVLARRTRALFLDARASIEARPWWHACWRRNWATTLRGSRAQISRFQSTARGYIWAQ